ncbi:GNAT family N-acetyltransferase [Sulfitobacter sp. MF3-043]|uniref:GNAT family N-acetyltransferase n=1 Tax=Sulfitobacter sediminivivens TaxID=3252902 RepID=UPI0036DD5C3F
MTHLRPARTTDAGTVGAILSEFAETTSWMPSLHTRAENIAHAGHLIDRGWVTVAEHDGGVVGFIASDGTEIDALYVTRSVRGHGVGSALLDDARAKAAHLSLWTFQVNVRACAFYERHGFVEVARTDGSNTDEKLPDVRYEWKVEAA